MSLQFIQQGFRARHGLGGSFLKCRQILLVFRQRYRNGINDDLGNRTVGVERLQTGRGKLRKTSASPAPGFRPWSLWGRKSKRRRIVFTYLGAGQWGGSTLTPLTTSHKGSTNSATAVKGLIAPNPGESR